MDTKQKHQSLQRGLLLPFSSAVGHTLIRDICEGIDCDMAYQCKLHQMPLEISCMVYYSKTEGT